MGAEALKTRTTKTPASREPNGTLIYRPEKALWKKRPSRRPIQRKRTGPPSSLRSRRIEKSGLKCAPRPAHDRECYLFIQKRAGEWNIGLLPVNTDQFLDSLSRKDAMEHNWSPLFAPHEDRILRAGAARPTEEIKQCILEMYKKHRNPALQREAEVCLKKGTVVVIETMREKKD